MMMRVMMPVGVRVYCCLFCMGSGVELRENVIGVQQAAAGRASGFGAQRPDGKHAETGLVCLKGHRRVGGRARDDAL